jgi:menaquinone-dependent protoporphyrinogen oxidase
MDQAEATAADQNAPAHYMPPTLVLYASIEGHTERIAQRIAGELRSRGHLVDVASAMEQPDVSAYAGVIVGASVHYAHHPAWLAVFLHRHAGALRVRKSAFFSVSLGAKARYVEKLLRDVAWRPQLTAMFAGALQYSKYKPFKRLVVRVFAAVAGHDTDISRDYDYTDWKAVDSFAIAFSNMHDPRY